LQTALAGAATSAEVTAITEQITATQAALDSAIAGNTTSIASLLEQLEALAAELVVIKTDLAAADTSADVAALTAALAAAQTDLSTLLAQNNIYSSSISVTNQAELDFATALGNKVSIVNGGVTITQTATMDATQLGTLMAKMTSITGAVVYSTTSSSTTSQSFTNLTGASSVDLNQTGNISMPKLATTGALILAGDTLTTSVSFPALTSATSGLSALSFSKATSVSFPVLAKYDQAISITTDENATVDLSALTSAAATVGYTTIDALTIVNASVLNAPMFDKGAIIADEIASVDLPKWQSLSASSSFANAKTVVLPAVNPGKAAGAVIAINSVFPKATSVHIIAAPSTMTSVTTANHMDVTSNSTNLDTLILGGTFSDVTISAGADLTSLTFDGSALNVSITGTDLASIDIPYTSLAKGSLTIKDNLDLASVTASKVDGLKGLTITGNTELSTISFAALKTSAAAASVDVSGNDLVIDNVQQASATGVTPVVAKKITSADFSPLKAYFDAAIAAATATAGSGVNVIADDVLVSTSAAGVATNNPSGDETIINYDLNIKSNATSTGAVARVNEFEVTGQTTLSVNGFVSSAVGILQIVFTNLILGLLTLQT